ncbi:MAG: RagB/SusD family nutrient uptake outer membrane protein [Pedobacter sp.]|nr:MAG: RagB/SusD family nutrient uptake outer membrane protein [Pedobacter sp.]
MKKILLLTFAALLMVVSCKKDPLDQTPDGKITLEEVFTDKDRTEAYLSTAYSRIPDYFWKYSFFAFLAGVTDEAKDSDVGNNAGNIASFWNTGSLSLSTNPLEAYGGQGKGISRYVTYWSGIRDCNVFLANIPKAAVANEDYRKRFTAEAKVLRSFYYLELIKQFGGMPIVDKPFEVTFDYTSLKRPTFQECVNFIVKNCDEAIAEPQFPLRITLETERGRFTKAVAYAIKSQALLYNASPLWNPTNDMAKWTASANASKEAIAALAATGQFALNANYGNYFLNQSDLSPSPGDKETIFEINEPSNGTFSVINSIPSKPGMFKAGSCPSQELVDAYDMQINPIAGGIAGEPAILGYSDADHLQPIINNSGPGPASGYARARPYVGRDPRFYATVWFNGAQYDNINGAIHTIETFQGGADQLIKNPPNRANTHTGYYLRKFIDPRIQSNQPHNSRWKKYRLAEIYLNLAEAENEVNGPTAAAYAAVNVVRNRAQMPNLPAGLDKDQFRIRVRRERRVEFAMEEHRFWDVRRWKILDQTDKVVTGMEIIKDPVTGVFTYNRFVTERRNAWTDKYLIFPIPLGEASIIPDFDLHQNPGW